MSEEKNLCIYRFSKYKVDKDIPLDRLPPQQSQCRSRSFLRLTRYRPQITAKRKILWKADAHLVDGLFPVWADSRDIDYEINPLGAMTKMLVCRWNSDKVQDFNDYRHSLQRNRKGCPSLRNILKQDLLRVYYLRVHKGDIPNFSFITSFCKINIIENADLSLIDLCSESSSLVQTAGSALLPTLYVPEDARILLPSDACYNNQIGWHNKSFIDEDKDLSEHERARLMISLIGKGWITAKK